MPAGTTWPRYLTFSAAAMFSMFLGSQTVHIIYKPLDDMPEVLKKYREQKAISDPPLRNTDLPRKEDA